MLDCGGNTAFNEIQKQTNNNTLASIETLNTLFKLDREAAEKELKARGITNTEAVLAKTHCTPPEGFFIVSEDMVGKSGVWAHFGSWNFTRAKISLDSKLPYDQAVAQFKGLGFTEKDAVSLYNEVKYLGDAEVNNWIAPWPSFLQGAPSRCARQGDGLLCENGVAVNLSNYDTRMSIQGNVVMPSRIVYWDGKNEIRNKTFNTTADVAVILMPIGNGEYMSMLAQDRLAGSLFTRLFYLEGHGLEHFTKIFDERNVIGWRIMVYQIDWDGHAKNTPYNATSLGLVKPQNTTVAA